MSCSPLSDPPPIPVTGASVRPKPKPLSQAGGPQRRSEPSQISQESAIGRPRLLAARAQHFAATASAAGWARRHVVDMLLRWSASELADDAALVASELVANAFKHATASEGTSTCRLVLKLFVDRLAIEVWDPAPVPPEAVRPRDVGEASESGRGLAIVTALCGSAPLVFVEPDRGKTVVAVIPWQRYR
ncbi:ATP-binding protein [Catenulispora acidiphila]|uniref:ATP-binding protein n=1 Tax=Catenulispora acidiphila TaxID=304895 RepID=UPI0011810E82